MAVRVVTAHPTRGTVISVDRVKKIAVVRYNGGWKTVKINEEEAD